MLLDLLTGEDLRRREPKPPEGPDAGSASTSRACTSSYHWLKSSSTSSLVGLDKAMKIPLGMSAPSV